jgi:hypothetical protein
MALFLSNLLYSNNSLGVTVVAGTNLTGGGALATGNSVTLNLNTTISSLTSLDSATITSNSFTSDSVTSGSMFSNNYAESIKTIVQASSSQAKTLDLALHQNFTHTLANNVTYTFANSAVNKASSFTLKVVQDAAGSGYTVTWPASVDWPAATAPTLTAGANTVDVFVFYTHTNGSTWYGFTAGQNLS